MSYFYSDPAYMTGTFISPNLSGRIIKNYAYADGVDSNILTFSLVDSNTGVPITGAFINLIVSGNAVLSSDVLITDVWGMVSVSITNIIAETNIVIANYQGIESGQQVTFIYM